MTSQSFSDDYWQDGQDTYDTLIEVLKEKKMDIDDDFGFSLVSEKELKAHEETLRQKIAEQSKVVVKTTEEMQNKLKQTSEELQNKLHGLRKMVMPLLNNLAKDPERDYIHWPDRVEKIQKFINKINNYVDNP
jgi:hypothetical protein